jgi:eukaryotic-like serine/threonine-protein kinase
MTPERFARLRELFAAAERLPPAERPAFLSAECPTDPDLAAEVLGLLKTPDDTATDDFLGPPLAMPAPALSPGGKIDKFQILELVGRGGMGAVYRARRLDDYQQDVAIKLVNRSDAGPAFLQRFRQERQILAGLEHPNIARLLDGGETAHGLPYLVMEFIPGRPLDEFCDANRLPLADRVQLVRTVCEAVAFAHARHVVHRDLKPANILVLPDGTPKVTDFGLAKRTDPGPAGPTETGAVLGTPSYMSPEQAAGQSGTISPATDVYALGAILYRLLTDRPPVSADNPVSAILHVLNDDPVPPRRVRPSIPRDLETICLKCLEKNPARRYPTARELADDLARYANNEPILARPIGWAGRSAKWARRHPTRAAVAGLSLLAAGVIVGLAVSFVVRLRGEQAETRKAQDELRRREAQVALDRALVHLERGHADRGLLELAVALRNVRDDEADLQRVIRLNLAAWASLSPIQAVLPDDEPIQTLAFGPDGEAFVTGSVRGEARLWDRDGKPLGPPLTHPDEVYGVALSPDGRTVVTGCRNGTVSVWDARTGTLIRQERPDEHQARAVAVSPDGRTAAVGSGTIFATGGVVRLWDLASGKWVGEDLKIKYPPRALAFMAKGRRLVVTGEGQVPHVWDLETKQVEDLPAIAWGWLYQVFVSADDRFIGGATRDRSVWVWDRSVTPPRLDRLEHPADALSLAFGADGRTIAVGCGEAGGDGAVYHWRWDDAARKWTMTGRPSRQSGLAQALARTADGFLCASRFPRCRLWVVPPPASVPEFLHDGGVTSVAFSPDGQFLTTGSGNHDPPWGRVRAWRTDTGVEQPGPVTLPTVVENVAYSPDGRALLAHHANGITRVWRTTGPWADPTVIEQGQVTSAVAWTPGGRLVIGREDGKAFLRDLTGPGPGTPLPHPDAVYVAAVNPDGTTALTGSKDGKARVWRIADGELIHVLPVRNGDIRAAAFDRKGKRAATGGADKTAQVWDAASWRPIGRTLLHAERVWAVAFSPDGWLVATGSGAPTEPGEARFWDTVTGIPVGPSLPHGDRVWSLAFHPDGRRLATACPDRRARLWPVPTPVQGSAERLILWTQVMTGMEIDPGTGLAEPVVTFLSAEAWEERRERLQALGGPPR